MADQAVSPNAALQNEGYAPVTSQKRKRDEDQADDSGRAVRQHTTNGDTPTTAPSSDQLQEQLLQVINQANGVTSDDSARTAQAALATPMVSHTYPEPYDQQAHVLPQYGDDTSHSPPSGLMGSTSYSLHTGREASTPLNQPKPAVGTPQWHQQRKDNHKEVERRRRETINDGINEIAKIVPGCEKNKGSILQRAVSYIGELHQVKKTLNNESATMNAVVQELQIRIEALKDQLQQSWTESSKWQNRCREAGLEFDDYEPAPGGGQSDLEPNPEST